MDRECELTGRIMKGIAGFYYVNVEDDGVYECRAVGIFRKDKQKPLVGDLVKIRVLDSKKREGSLVGICKRSTALIRPEVANVDQALIVFAQIFPEPNLILLDKFLIMMLEHEIECVICFNKQDMAKDSKREELLNIYSGCGVKVITISALEAQGLQQIRELLKNKFTVLAGPSGVGKSTLINHLCPQAKMETGEISKKMERGKHTTRHSELFYLDKGTYLMDTPGFTAFSLMDMPENTIKNYYPEFYPYEGKCKYQECSHIHEPKCAVKDAVQTGAISRIRYEGYLTIYEEQKNRRKY